MIRSDFKTFLTAWILSWAVAVFLPSILIAYLGLSPAATELGSGFARLFETSWKVADDVAPAAKLMIGGIMLAGLVAADRLSTAPRAVKVVVGFIAGLLAVFVTSAFLPADFSRGFGIGLAGLRFDPTLTALYLTGGALGGGLGGWLLTHR